MAGRSGRGFLRPVDPHRPDGGRRHLDVQDAERRKARENHSGDRRAQRRCDAHVLPSVGRGGRAARHPDLRARVLRREARRAGPRPQARNLAPDRRDRFADGPNGPRRNGRPMAHRRGCRRRPLLRHASRLGQRQLLQGFHRHFAHDAPDSGHARAARRFAVHRHGLDRRRPAKGAHLPPRRHAQGNAKGAENVALGALRRRRFCLCLLVEQP